MDEIILDSNDPIMAKLTDYIIEVKLGDMAGSDGDFIKSIYHLKIATEIAENEKFENLINSVSPIKLMTRQQISKPHFLLGWAYQSINEYEKAIESYNKALLIDPKYEQRVLLHRGICKGSIEQYIDAILDFDLLIRLDPNCYDAFKFRGLAWLEIKDKYKAKSDLEKAYRLGCPESEALLKEIFGN